MAKGPKKGAGRGNAAGRGSVGLRLLELLQLVAAAEAPLSPAEIGQRLTLPKPTVHRLCAWLEAEGYLARDPGGRAFRIGIRTEQLAFNVIRRGAVTAQRHAVLEGLVGAIGETCNFTTLAGHEVLYVDRVESRWPLRMTLEPGSRVPLHCTASGKLFLAAMDAPRRRRILDGLELPALTPNTLTDRASLEQELARITENRCSTDNEEFIVGLIAVAVPVLDDKGRVMAAVACHAPKARLPLDQALTYLPRMREAAAALGQTLC